MERSQSKSPSRTGRCYSGQHDHSHHGQRLVLTNCCLLSQASRCHSSMSNLYRAARRWRSAVQYDEASRPCMLFLIPKLYFLHLKTHFVPPSICFERPAQVFELLVCQVRLSTCRIQVLQERRGKEVEYCHRLAFERLVT